MDEHTTEKKGLTLDGEPVTIEERLGGGRYSEVFAARTGTAQVVVKIARTQPLGPEAASATGAFAQAEALERLTGNFGAAQVEPNLFVRAEADLLAKLGDGLFPKLLGRGEDQERAFFMMESILGRTFRESAGAATPTPTHFAALATDLDRLRSTKVMALHGDLKPDNLMLDVKGRVRALDPSAYGWRVESGQVKAMLMTPFYNPWGDASDVPALAITMFETYYGEHPLLNADESLPLPRRSENLERIYDMANATGRAPLIARLLSSPPLRETAPKITTTAEDAVYRALHLRMEADGSFDWDDGFASCIELVTAFGAPK